MPECFKHASDDIEVRWDIGVECPLCKALDENKLLMERAEKLELAVLAQSERFQDLLDNLKGGAPSSLQTRRRPPFQAPRGSSVAVDDDFDWDEEG